MEIAEKLLATMLVPDMGVLLYGILYVVLV